MSRWNTQEDFKETEAGGYGEADLHTEDVDVAAWRAALQPVTEEASVNLAGVVGLGGRGVAPLHRVCTGWGQIHCRYYISTHQRQEKRIYRIWGQYWWYWRYWRYFTLNSSGGGHSAEWWQWKLEPWKYIGRGWNTWADLDEKVRSFRNVSQSGHYHHSLCYAKFYIGSQVENLER